MNFKVNTFLLIFIIIIYLITLTKADVFKRHGRTDASSEDERTEASSEDRAGFEIRRKSLSKHCSKVSTSCLGS